MQSVWRGIVVLFGIGQLSFYAQPESPGLGERLSTPISIERESAIAEIPLTVRSGKIYLDASVNEFSGEFLFDTGSPTILDQALADQLDLEIIGENTGRDANGKPVSMKIAIASSITIGTTIFYDVPVMVHDYSKVPLGKCYIPNGVLGSELLPGSAWRLDMPNRLLKIASNIEALPQLAETQSSSLNIFGYPFAPIVDYAIGRFSDKALFDTGSSADIALFEAIANDKWVRKQIDRQSIEEGYGRLGTSAGGIGDSVALQKFQLKTVRIGEYDLGRSDISARPVPPTLVGAGLLNSHIVTLDYPNARFLLSPAGDPIVDKPDAGFALMVNGERVEVSQIYNESTAQNAGLRLGDIVIAIDQRELLVSTDLERCNTSLWLSNEADLHAIQSLTILREQKIITLKF